MLIVTEPGHAQGKGPCQGSDRTGQRWCTGDDLHAQDQKRMASAQPETWPQGQSRQVCTLNSLTEKCFNYPNMLFLNRKPHLSLATYPALERRLRKDRNLVIRKIPSELFSKTGPPLTL